MAGARDHQYHILNPSIWPLIGSISAGVMFFGLVMWLHTEVFGQGVGQGVFFLGLIGVFFTMFSWWADVVKEANGGDHTRIRLAAPGLPKAWRCSIRSAGRCSTR
jgi:cytochrome c oxidase subunit III